jgi:hypothetical protein
MSDPIETPAHPAAQSRDPDQLCADLKHQIAKVRDMVREARETLRPQAKPDPA